MKFFDRFLNKPRTHVVTPKIYDVAPHAVSTLKRRPTVYVPFHQNPVVGMWIVEVSSGDVGILTKITPDDKVSSMLVAADGTNRMEIEKHSSCFRQAFVDEIPAPRRPPKDIAESLGYHRR